MDDLQKFAQNQPAELAQWLEQFPWNQFSPEVIIPRNEEADFAIARRVALQRDAEVQSLIICQHADIEEGAEIHGTLVCLRGELARDAECNYLIARSFTVMEDAEVGSAHIDDSLKIADGAEINELNLHDFTVIDSQAHSLIKSRNRQSPEAFRQATAQLLRLVLDSAAKKLA